jgi:hypothetical protein
MLIKLDAFFFVCFSLQLVVLVLEPSNLEFALTIATIPISLAFFADAIYALHHESKILMIFFLNGLGVGVAYLCFKTFRLYQTSQAFRYESSRAFLTVMSTVCLLVTILAFIYSIMCLYHFGMGLKEKIKEHGGARILVL